MPAARLRDWRFGVRCRAGRARTHGTAVRIPRPTIQMPATTGGRRRNAEWFRTSTKRLARVERSSPPFRACLKKHTRRGGAGPRSWQPGGRPAFGRCCARGRAHSASARSTQKTNAQTGSQPERCRWIFDPVTDRPGRTALPACPEVLQPVGQRFQPVLKFSNANTKRFDSASHPFSLPIALQSGQAGCLSYLLLHNSGSGRPPAARPGRNLHHLIL